MDIDKYLRPEFDFSRLGPMELELMGDITANEIVIAFKSRGARTYPCYPLEYDRWFCLGFGDRMRCLEIYFEFDDNHKISFIDINLANEYGIERYWCRQGR